MPRFLEGRAAAIAQRAGGYAAAEAGVADGESLGFDPMTILAIIGVIFQVVKCLRDRMPAESWSEAERPGFVTRWRVRSCARKVVGPFRARHAARAILEDAATLSLDEWVQARADGLAMARNAGGDDV